MANMSYCRFHNTRADMMDCLNALDNRSELSHDEYIACANMFHQILQWFEDEGVIEEMNWDAFDEWLEEIEERSK